MSRLDINIRRLKAQRACLNAAARAVQDLPGVALELGLGNGRTFDHLREIMPDREIFVFDREIAAHPDCIPDDAHMILGRFQETLPRAAERFFGQPPAPMFAYLLAALDPPPRPARKRPRPPRVAYPEPMAA